MYKLPILLFVILLTTISVFAQKGSIKGTLADKEGNTLPGATLMLLSAKDSTMEKFTISDRNGEFSMVKIKAGNYLLQISFVGFGNISKPVSIDDDRVTEAGTITMETESELLEKVVIEADRIPIVMKEDTIEYAADAFATRPGANVEDLLKKLPGIEVEADGTIKAQGEKVNKVLVDGKEFFGNDPQIATKNLPADAMDKVQVFDKLSDMAEFTGIDDGSRSKTINLTLKEDKKNGLFGNVTGGYGQEDRYKGKLNLNQFTKKQQLSVIASGNNINEQNFSLDDYISLSGGLSNIMSGGNGGQFSLSLDNGVGAALGLTDGGIRNNSSLGANFNRDLSDKTSLNTSYFFNELHNSLDKSTERQNFNGNDIFFSRGEMTSESQLNLHRLNTKLKFTPDERQDLTYQSTIKHTLSDNTVERVNQNFTPEESLLSGNTVNEQSEASNLVLENSLSYRRKFSRKGRSLTARLSGNLTDFDQSGSLLSATEFANQENSPSSVINQEQSEENMMQEWGIKTSYTEPILNGKLLQGFLSHSRISYDLSKNFFDIEQNGEKNLNQLLSATFDNKFIYNNGGFRLFLGNDKNKLTLGLSGQNSVLRGNATNVENILTRSFFNLLPSMRWNMDLA
ncbi:MAG: carboxypeptidase-like regulatory domain-containing protein, partial [Cyclobacteriaceae bacterium]